MERSVVRNFLYPVLFNPLPTLTLQFSDQFAFRPTGSTEAAIIALLHTVTNLLLSNPYVIVISLDFSKAFDTVRHYTLLQKVAELDLPDHVFNRLVDFFEGHSHQHCLCRQHIEHKEDQCQHHSGVEHRTSFLHHHLL